MTIYTRTGDSGDTDLFGGGREPKNGPRIETCGAVDELNAALGLVRAEAPAEEVDRLLGRIQNELFELGSEIACPQHPEHPVTPEHVRRLEAEIDRLEAGLAPLSRFILPTGSRAGAGLHLARTVCRRAERRLVAAISQAPETISPAPLAYLNRLSDLLFVLARHVNAQSGQADVPWTH
jgi:cob(I)alamin adenosyltransferase